MPRRTSTTSIHVPAELLEQLDKLARDTGTSRNRLIVDACRALVSRARSEWPEDFFSNDRFSSRDLRELQTGLEGWLETLAEERHSRRGGPPF